MLTHEQLARLQEHERRLAATPLDQPFVAEALRDVILALRHLSRPRPDEHEFKTYAAIVNDISAVAYAMRLDCPVAIEQRAVLGAHRVDGRLHGQPVFEHLVTVDVCNALLVVRPWIRISEPVTPEIIDRLSSARITFAVDDDAILDGTSLRDHLIGPDGYGLKHQAFTFKGLMSGAGGGAFFRAVELEPTNPGVAVMANWNTAPPGMNAISEKELGMMIPNGSKITIDVHGIEGLGNPVTVTTGLVAALYSTRSSRTLPKRKQDWSPRDP